jgi:hypothetical protein
MAFDNQGAAGGAMSGASAGMAAGPWGALVGGVAGGLMGGLSGKKKPKTPDMAAITNTMNQSAGRQGEIAANVKGQLAPLTSEYATGVRGLSDSLVDKTKAAAGEYLQNQATASEGMGRSLTDTLKQNVLSQQPELSRQLRESMAATGQLRSGASAAAQAGLANQLAQQIGQGQREIATQDLQSRQRALETAMQMNDGALQASTGLNKDALQAIFTSGRADLIDEATALINIEANRAGGIVGAQQNQITYDLAKQSADAANSNQLGSSLTGLIGSVAGRYGSRVPTNQPPASRPSPYQTQSLTGNA